MERAISSVGPPASREPEVAVWRSHCRRETESRPAAADGTGVNSTRLLRADRIHDAAALPHQN